MKIYLYLIVSFFATQIFIQNVFANGSFNRSTPKVLNNHSNLDSCVISNVRAEIYDCPQSLSYDVEVTFDFVNAGEKGYSISFDDDIIYQGGYKQNDSLQFIRLGPLNCSWSDYNTIKVFDNEFDYCIVVQPMSERIDCDQKSCKISNLVIQPKNCDSLNLFALDISFDYENVDEKGFSIFANETNIGTFTYTELDSLGYVTTKPIEADGETDCVIKVEDNRRCKCDQTYNIGTVNCSDLDCKIENLTAEIFCPGFSHIDNDLIIDFEYSNTQSSFFEVFLDRRSSLTFQFNDLPIAFNYNSSAENILVVEKDNLICFARAVVFETMCLPIEEVLQLDVKIYQTNERLIISDCQNVERINIFDLNGRNIYEATINKAIASIPIQSFSKGINIVRLKSGNDFISKKICIK